MPRLLATVVSVVLGSSLAMGSPTMAAAADGGRDSLPRVRSGALPGPELLYRRPVVAPQLQNTDPWRAKPILVSGATSYRSGEWLYQDFLQDDHGARGVRDERSPYNAEAHLYSPTSGTFTYPTDPVYAHNAADLVELRIRPLAHATAFRVTFNTMKDPARSAFTIALGGAAGDAVDWPHGAGVRSPAKRFLTWHGSTAELTDTTGRRLSPAPSVAVDLRRKQVTVRVPHRAWNPRRGTVRTTIGTGLWDTTAGRYLAPEASPATEDTPGGGTPLGAAIVNVGPRLAEPNTMAAGLTMADMAAGAAAVATWWREQEQGTQLALGDVSPFFAAVDFGKLRDKVRDDRAVPKRGSMNRILSSRFAFGQGVDPEKVCFSLSSRLAEGGGVAPEKDCTGRFSGRLQAYTLYVPKGPRPARGWGLTLLMHSLTANHNQYAGSRNQSQLGERGPGSLVVTPGGRGPDGFYAGAAEADLFETWADVAHHYRLQPRWAAASGYSMGGFGTYRMLARWPDLFGRGFSVVGVPGPVLDQLRSLRHNPVMSWVAGADELVNVSSQREAVEALTAAGVRFGNWTFPGADHLTLAGNDEYLPGAAFLGTHQAVRDPRHVTYVVDRREDTRIGRIRADHAWWLSGLRPGDPSRAGTIDARSLATPRGTPRVLDMEQGAGVLQGGQNQAMPYTTETRRWAAAPRQDARNVLLLRASNLRRVVVDVRRAGLTCDARVRTRTDRPLVVLLSGCGRRLEFPATGS